MTTDMQAKKEQLKAQVQREVSDRSTAQLTWQLAEAGAQMLLTKITENVSVESSERRKCMWKRSSLMPIGIEGGERPLKVFLAE
jgi:hypothetical protein